MSEPTLSVREFTLDIVTEARAYLTEEESIGVEFRSVESTDGEFAESAVIRSELGVVIVFPNFVGGHAHASILNCGKLNGLVQEGFDEDALMDEPVYSRLLEHSRDNAHSLGYYLSHKINE
jgi:hypothetical protein